MGLHTMSWLVTLICSGICFCDEGYFGAAHADFRKLCVILALPGRQKGPDPDTFKALWNRYLNTAGKKLFYSSDKNEQLKAAEDHCKESKTDNDPICAFKNFATIGNLVEHDVRKLQETFSSRSESAWYYYTHYIAAWFQHPQMARLDCGPTLKHLWFFMAKLSRLQAFDLLFRMKSVYDNSNAKGLRQEIERFCPVSSTEQICEIKVWTSTADKVEKLLNYVGQGHWNNSASEILKNAMRLHFYAVKLQFLNSHPSSSAWDFLSTENSEVNKWIKEIAFYVFDSLQKNLIENLGQVVELLPYTVDLPCDHTAKFPSLKKTICTFNSMIDSLSGYLAKHNARRNIKQISTQIDYEKFLQEKRLEQILNIGETAQYTLLLVVQHLKLEMKNNVGEFKKYFQTLADFDWKKVRVDIEYIQNTLGKYKSVSEQSSRKIDRFMDELIIAALTAAIGDQVETGIKLGIQIASAYNPLKTILGGGTATDILDATHEVFQAMANVAKAAKLKEAFVSFIDRTRNFIDKLGKNQIYLDNVASLIDSLTTNVSSLSSSSEFEAQKNKFLHDYNNYSPAVTKDDLRGITAYWENLIDEACDILDSTSGTVSGTTKTILAAQRTCPNAKVEVQKLITTYEEIYDFQFNLMDALAACMRAFTSYQAANVIYSDFDAITSKDAYNPEIFAELELLSAFSMVCYKISMLTAIDSYCDILAYTEGHLPRECTGAGTSITSLLSRTKLTCTPLIAFQQIPTKPSKPGDKSYISLKDLYAGETVVFKIPDNQWLIDHRWISSFQRNRKIFVQRFEIYLPVVSKTKKQVDVKVQATVGNQLTPPDGTEYVISPRTPLLYTYREGKSGRECRQKEISNPYNDKCRGMPKICPITKGSHDDAPQGNIFPSIYAQWNINIYGYENDNLDVPSTDIPLRAALQLCVLPEDYNNGIPKRAEKQRMRRKAYNSEALSLNSTCCGSNHYYDESTCTCTACPAGTVDKYKGLLCGNEIRFLPAPTNMTIFSLNNAQDTCTKAKTTIASTLAMQRAVARGYKACECGWLADGTIEGLKPNVRCKENGGLSTFTCSSRNTWGVYCINKF